MLGLIVVLAFVLAVGGNVDPAVGVVVVGFLAWIAVWLLMRPGQPDLRSQEDVARFVRGGKPSVIELYSNFCLVCMQNRRTLASAATKLRGMARFARVELPTAAGRAVGETYGVRYTPSYLIFDAHGDLVRRIIPDNVTPLASGYRILDEGGALVRRARWVTADVLADVVRFAS